MDSVKEMILNLFTTLPSQIKTLMMVTGISTTMTLFYYTFIHKRKNSRGLKSIHINKINKDLSLKQFSFMKDSFNLSRFGFWFGRRFASKTEIFNRKLIDFNTSQLKKLQPRNLIQRNDQMFYNIMVKLVKAKFA